MADPTLNFDTPPAEEAATGVTDLGPAGDHGAAQPGLPEAELVGAPADLEPEPLDSGPSAAVSEILAAVQIPENLEQHWDHAGAESVYAAAIAEGVAPETVSRLVTLWATGQAAQLDGLTEGAAERADDAEDAAEAAFAEQSRKTLQEGWKSGYSARVKTAQNAAANLFDSDAFEALCQTKLANGGRLGDDPKLIRALEKMGHRMALESTPALAQKELSELEEDSAFNESYFDQSDTDSHRRAVEKHTQLFEKAYPEEAPAPIQTASAEERRAAKAELRRYADVKGLGKELSTAMGSLDEPADRDPKTQAVLARWSELNAIADAPLESADAGTTFAGKPWGDTGAALTQEQARDEIAKIESTAGFWSEDTSASDLAVHRKMVARRDRLYAVAYPS